jgi:hypothetical protein
MRKFKLKGSTIMIKKKKQPSPAKVVAEKGCFNPSVHQPRKMVAKKVNTQPYVL